MADVVFDTSAAGALDTIPGAVSATDTLGVKHIIHPETEIGEVVGLQAELNKIIKAITVSGGTITLTKTDGTTLTATIGTATASADGLLSKTDKTKLDGIATGANNYSLPTATSGVLGGVKIGSNITNSSGTISLSSANVVNALGYTPSNASSSSGVTGVKGSSETTYRTGQVNITAANVGAAASSHTHVATDITSGTLSVARGGTGKTDLNDVTVGKSSEATKLSNYRHINGYYFNGEDGVHLGGYCGTPAGTVAKEVEIRQSSAKEYFLTNYNVVCVYFNYANTASNPTLNVSESGAKPIKRNGVATSDIDKGAVLFQFYNNAWNIVGSASSSSGTIDSATKATQDESGNNIKASYAASMTNSGSTITLKNKNGATLSTVTVPNDNTTNLTQMTGVLPIANGGTGQTTAAAIRNALGLGNTTGVLPIANGGTGNSEGLVSKFTYTNLGNVNVDELIAPGLYYVGYSSSNLPTSSYSNNMILVISNATTASGTQVMAYQISSDIMSSGRTKRLHCRVKFEGSWSAWNQLM